MGFLKDSFGKVARRGTPQRPITMNPLIQQQQQRVLNSMPKFEEPPGRTSGVVGHPTEEEGPKEILIFGESTAVAVGADSLENGLGGQLARILGRSGTPMHWTSMGHTGYTAARAMERLLPRIGQRKFDLIVVVLGVNDVLRHNSAPMFGAAVRSIVAELRSNLTPSGRIVLAGLPNINDLHKVPQPARSMGALWARALDRELAKLARSTPRVTFVATPRLRSDRLRAEDGLHPSTAGYQTWAEELAAAVS